MEKKTDHSILKKRKDYDKNLNDRKVEYDIGPSKENCIWSNSLKKNEKFSFLSFCYIS